MSLKRIFGIVFTVLGAAALIYTASTFINTRGSAYDTKLVIVYGLLGFLFFVSGLGLIKGTKDSSV